jgi:aminopeptidase N
LPNRLQSQIKLILPSLNYGIANRELPKSLSSENYDADKKEYTLTLKQYCKPTEKEPTKEAFHIPLLIGLLDPEGKDYPLNSKDISYNSDKKALIHFKKDGRDFCIYGN